MRTFIAIELPETARRIVAQLQAPLARISGIRTTKPEQCHVTLKFLGEIDEVQRETFGAALSEIEQTAFELSLTNLGSFPNPRRPRVVWVGVTNPPELAELAAKVDRATSAVPLDKPFKPHVTLARITMRGARLEPAALEQPVPPCTFAVKEFLFYESVLGPAGSTHGVLRRFSLRG